VSHLGQSSLNNKDTHLIVLSAAYVKTAGLSPVRLTAHPCEWAVGLLFSGTMPLLSQAPRYTMAMREWLGTDRAKRERFGVARQQSWKAAGRAIGGCIKTAVASESRVCTCNASIRFICRS